MSVGATNHTPNCNYMARILVYVCIGICYMQKILQYVIYCPGNFAIIINILPPRKQDPEMF